jgi:DNA-directed RNA polymerase subunit RPC12/RpoP
MFARVVCPACQYKFSIPEGDMGKRQVCGNCQSPFVAGKSIGEAEAPEISMKLQPAAASPFNKTMLGETAPPIKFSCPRCKKPLEAPAIEAGTKKPCPECGQRLQVPAAPVAAPPTAAQPNLNKTLLASDESKPQPPIKYNCPNCQKPLESPASEALTKKPCPACGQRLQVPAAPSPGAPQPNLNKTILASDESKAAPTYGQPGQPASATTPSGTTPASQTVSAPLTVSKRGLMISGMIAGGVILLLLLTCLIITGPGKSAEREKMAKAQKVNVQTVI